MPEPISEVWPTIPQVAALNQVSEKTIRRQIASGDLRARRIGSRLIRIDPESVRELGTPMGGDAA